MNESTICEVCDGSGWQHREVERRNRHGELRDTITVVERCSRGCTVPDRWGNR